MSLPARTIGQPVNAGLEIGIDYADGTAVTVIGGSESARRKRAALMAAAPELCAAAELALKEAENWIHDQLDGTSELDRNLATLEPVRAALAKARGETP